MSDEVHQAFRGAHVSQERRPVQRVEAGHGEIGGIANVVQDRSSLQKVRVLSSDAPQGPGLTRDTLDVRPSAGQRLKLVSGNLRRPGSSRRQFWTKILRNAGSR